ncbi:MAG: GNAT family N-acetyltransferase [Chloroflexota bacterium]|nr:GNAT family N-acetyltransferase [Chloroflexota bacterium]
MLTGKKVVLREKLISDALDDYAWRSDPELAGFDGVQPLAMFPQEYTLYYVDELRRGDLLKRWFGIDNLEGKHIGNCMYYDMNESRKQVKIGIMIGDREYWGKGYGTEVITLLVDYLFENTEMDRIYLDTLDWNLRAQKCFQKCGFVLSGNISRSGKHFFVMELYRSWHDPHECDTT